MRLWTSRAAVVDVQHAVEACRELGDLSDVGDLGDRSGQADHAIPGLDGDVRELLDPAERGSQPGPEIVGAARVGLPDRGGVGGPRVLRLKRQTPGPGCEDREPDPEARQVETPG